jgi:hypothetical protein
MEIYHGIITLKFIRFLKAFLSCFISLASLEHMISIKRFSFVPIPYIFLSKCKIFLNN